MVTTFRTSLLGAILVSALVWAVWIPPTPAQWGLFLALGLISPPLALLALIETGGAEDTPCAALLAKRRETPAKP